MGNVKSRNDFDKTNRKISRNLSQPQLSTPPSSLTSSSGREQNHQQQRPRHHQGGEDKWTTTTTTSAILSTEAAVNTTTTTTAVGGPLVEGDVKNTNDNSKITKHNKAKEDPQQTRRQRQQKAADSSAACAVALTEQQQQQQQQRQQRQHNNQEQQQQRLKQASFWSLGSLNWNLSFSGRNSYKQRQKSSRKSFSTLQYQRRSKTQWHRPLTNAIFSSHFKESSRNGEFHIDRLVAKGAFGVVFRVVDKNSIPQSAQQQQQKQQPHSIANALETSTNTPVYALKVLKKSKIISENSVQQIKDEADIQKLCGHHPFIVKQFDLWQNRYNLHILSEFIPNGELFSKISTFSLNLIRVYLAEIALALDFLHNAGIIYRDAKPENILLTADYHLKLTDFGLSKWLKFGLTTKTICGTFQYMAPEILRGEPYTHSVDWWSLGIIVCQMFVKKSPDIRQFITVTLPEHLQPNDSVDNMVAYERAEDATLPENPLKSVREYLPEEVQNLPHEGRDVLQRLLDFDGHKRLHSVRALQRIAMYKDFKIEAHYIQKIRPLDIIAADNIILYTDEDQPEQNGIDVDKTFRNF